MDMPTQPPRNPLPLARQWLEAALEIERKNPWAMALATVGSASGPSCRYVLLKSIDDTLGFVVFYTNYQSHKANEIDATGSAAAALYWPHPGRQLRFEGVVRRSPAGESDSYFAERPRPSQLNAWASAQSRPVPPAGMQAALAAMEQRFAKTAVVPRPPHWGGLRLWLAAVEFWIEGESRFHRRVRYERALGVDPEQNTGPWSYVELQP